MGVGLADILRTARKAMRITMAVLPLGMNVSCGHDATGPKPQPGKPPAVALTLTPTQDDVPYLLNATAVVSGDSLKPNMQVSVGSHSFTVPINGAGTYEFTDSVKNIGADTAIVSVQNEDNKTAADTVVAQGSNTPPHIASKTVSKDSTAVGDSAQVQVISADTRPGFTTTLSAGAATATHTASGTADTVRLWIKPASAGTQYVRANVTDPQGASAIDSVALRSFFEQASAYLSIQPVRADTAPFSPTVRFVMHQPRIPFDSAVMHIGSLTYRRTGATTTDTLLAQPTLTTLGKVAIDAIAYNRAGNVTSTDTLEVLAIATTPPGFAVSVPATGREVDSIPVTLNVSAPRGLAYVVLTDSVFGHSKTKLDSISLHNDTLVNIVRNYRLSPGHHIIGGIATNKDELSTAASAGPLLVWHRPLITLLTAPDSVIYQPNRTIDVLINAMADSGLSIAQCIAMTSQGFTDSSTSLVRMLFNNASHAADSSRVNGSLYCRDNRGMVTDTAAFSVMTKHSHPILFETYDVAGDTLAARTLVVNSDTIAMPGTRNLVYTRPNPAVVYDLHSRWAGSRMHGQLVSVSKPTGENMILPVTDSMLVYVGVMDVADSALARNIADYTTGTSTLGGWPAAADADTTKKGFQILYEENNIFTTPDPVSRDTLLHAFDIIRHWTATPDSVAIDMVPANGQPNIPIEIFWKGLPMPGYGITGTQALATPLYGGYDNPYVPATQVWPYQGVCTHMFQAFSMTLARNMRADGIDVFPSIDYWYNIVAKTPEGDCTTTEFGPQVVRALGWLGAGYDFGPTPTSASSFGSAMKNFSIQPTLRQR